MVHVCILDVINATRHHLCLLTGQLVDVTLAGCKSVLYQSRSVVSLDVQGISNVVYLQVLYQRLQRQQPINAGCVLRY